VDFRVSEIHARRVRVGQTVLITSDAAPDGVYEGAIYAIDPIIDVNGRSIRLRANFPNPKGRLSPGFFVRISVVTERRPDAVVVPESAIFPIGGRTLVYKIVDGRARQADVVLGQRMPGRVEVREGLARGDIIVTAGQQRLREGAPVRMVSGGA
jgi:membrane fusion protein (multidrug efflux system)